MLNTMMIATTITSEEEENPNGFELELDVHVVQTLSIYTLPIQQLGGLL